MDNAILTGKREYQYLYSLRSIAMIYIVLLHSMANYYNDLSLFGGGCWWLCNISNAFVRAGVPCFFMISGFLLLNDDCTRDIRKFYGKRLPRILIPLLFWNVIYYIYEKNSSGTQFDIWEMLSQIIDNGTSYHLWFVYTLFGLYLLMPFIKRIVDSCTIGQLWLFFGLCAFTGTIRTFINTVTPAYVYLFAPLTNGYLAFVVLGYILGVSDYKKIYRYIIYFLGVVGLQMGIFSNWTSSGAEKLDFSTANCGYGINNFLTATAIFVLVKSLPEIKNRFFKSVVKTYSKATYGIYLIHVLVLELLIENVHLNSTDTVELLFRFMVTLIVSSAAMLVISKVKYVNKIMM